MRRTFVPVVALTMACVLTAVTACSGSSGRKKRSRSGDRPAAAAKKDTPRRGKGVAGITCAELRDASLGNSRVRYNGYPDAIPLADGVWSGEDGARVELQQPCAIGDLDGDQAGDAVGTVLLEAGGTGRFWSLVVWRNDDGEPEYLTLAELGDRTPVQSISVADRRATVVYLTRSSGRGMAELDIRRTATYELAGTRFAEVTHTDAPYAP